MLGLGLGAALLLQEARSMTTSTMALDTDRACAGFQIRPSALVASTRTWLVGVSLSPPDLRHARDDGAEARTHIGPRASLGQRGRTVFLNSLGK